MHALGANAGLTTAVSPESAVLLRVRPDPGDPLTAQVRAQRAGVDFLRAVASPRRPVVFFVDDLHWAGRMPLGLFDLLLDEAPIEGLLLVGAYREQEVDAAHPLAQFLDPSRDRAGVEHIRLANLSRPSLAALVAETLHVDRAAATALAEAIQPQTSRQSVRDGRGPRSAAPRRRADGHAFAVAVGWRGRSRSSGPLRGGRVVGGADRRPAAGVAGGRGVVGVSRGASRAARATHRNRRTRDCRGAAAAARTRRRSSGRRARRTRGRAIPSRPHPRDRPEPAPTAAPARPAAGDGEATGCRAGVVRGRGGTVSALGGRDRRTRGAAPGGRRHAPRRRSGGSGRRPPAGEHAARRRAAARWTRTTSPR